MEPEENGDKKESKASDVHIPLVLKKPLGREREGGKGGREILEEKRGREGKKGRREEGKKGRREEGKKGRREERERKT